MSGFITLNKTRKAVLLMEDDPLAYSMPLVGVWIQGTVLSSCTGASLGKSWESALRDPTVWAACVRYMSNQHIKERVSPPESRMTFLVLAYVGEDSSQACFMECSASLQSDGTASPLPFSHAEFGFEINVDGKPQSDGMDIPDCVDCVFQKVDLVTRRMNFRNIQTKGASADFDFDQSMKQLNINPLYSTRESHASFNRGEHFAVTQNSEQIYTRKCDCGCCGCRMPR